MKAWLPQPLTEWDPISRGFSCWIVLLHSNGVSTAGSESQQKPNLVCGVVCMPFIWLNTALLGTSGWGQNDPASAEDKPVVYCQQLNQGFEGIRSISHLNTARRKSIICLTEILGVTKIFYSHVHSKHVAGADSIARKQQYGFNSSSE